MEATSSKTAHDIQWETNYHLLVVFIAEYGRLPKRNEIYRGTKLGEWCSNQRRRAVQPNYPQNRYERLKHVGFFDASRRIQEMKWEEHYILLRSFIEEHHRFPQTQDVYNRVNIGKWYFAQKAKMKNPDYPEEHLEKLYALGITETSIKENWQQHFQLLEDFIKEYDRLPKQLEEYQGFKIGLWCARQKQQAKQSNYPEEYFEKLAKIGLFDSNQSKSKKGNRYTSHNNRLWDEKYQLLIEFIEKYGRVPSAREIYKNVNIGDWYNHQKKLLKYGRCLAERKEKLAALGISVDNNNNS